LLHGLFKVFLKVTYMLLKLFRNYILRLFKLLKVPKGLHKDYLHYLKATNGTKGLPRVPRGYQKVV
jgi:hypothetical protein